MLVTKMDNVETDNVKIGTGVLERVQEMKYLGIVLDSKLNFKSHFEKTILKLKKKVSVLRRLRFCCTKKVKKLLFETLVKPHVNYCSTIFNYANQDAITRIQTALNDGMRAVLNVTVPMDTHVVDMIKELNMLKFEDMVYLDSMTMIYKLENDLLPEHLTRYLRRRREVHEHDTRIRDNFYLGSRRMQGAHNTIFYKSVTKYNQIDHSIKESTSVKQFRRKITKQLIEDY